LFKLEHLEEVKVVTRSCASQASVQNAFNNPTTGKHMEENAGTYVVDGHETRGSKCGFCSCPHPQMSGALG
jgi:hypothetical protein